MNCYRRVCGKPHILDPVPSILKGELDEYGNVAGSAQMFTNIMGVRLLTSSSVQRLSHVLAAAQP